MRRRPKTAENWAGVWRSSARSWVGKKTGSVVLWTSPQRRRPPTNLRGPGFFSAGFLKTHAGYVKCVLKRVPVRGTLLIRKEIHGYVRRFCLKSLECIALLPITSEYSFVAQCFCARAERFVVLLPNARRFFHTGGSCLDSRLGMEWHGVHRGADLQRIFKGSLFENPVPHCIGVPWVFCKTRIA